MFSCLCRIVAGQTLQGDIISDPGLHSWPSFCGRRFLGCSCGVQIYSPLQALSLRLLSLVKGWDRAAWAEQG